MPNPEDLRMPSAERMGFVEGLLKALDEQTKHHVQLVQDLAEMQARVNISERNLRHTRDYLRSTLETTEEDVPENWREVIDRVRFVGARLGDAALDVLKTRGHPLTVEEIESALNDGQFRFRTGHPKREIHGALLRQRLVRRDAETETWEYVNEEKPAQKAS